MQHRPMIIGSNLLIIAGKDTVKRANYQIYNPKNADIGIFPYPFRENPLQTSRFCRSFAARTKINEC
jgi:hypothetical protein